MKGKEYVVIGLGKFGSQVARTIYEMGNEVLAIDIDEHVVNEIANDVTHSVQLDSTDEQSLKTLGIGNFDVAIIAIGGEIQSSVMTTLLVKELGAKYIIAKANNDLHAKVLQKIGADKVILPEQDMAIRVAHNVASNNIMDYIELSHDYGVVEVTVPDQWVGKTMTELNVRAKYGVNIVAVKNSNTINVTPSPNVVFRKDDKIFAIGNYDEIGRLEVEVIKNNERKNNK